MAWEILPIKGDIEQVMVMGKAGAIPASTANDQADFLVVVTRPLTLSRMKTSVLTKPGGDTTVQLRKSTDGGATFSNVTGWTVSITAAGTGKVHTSDPTDEDVNEGDVLNFSITGGGGSGTNLAVFVIAKAR